MQALLQAGQLDELEIQLGSVLLGAGRRPHRVECTICTADRM